MNKNSAERVTALARRAAQSDVAAVVVGPGADLSYLLGRSIGSHERLTCLVVPAQGSPWLLVPALERPGWEPVLTHAAAAVGLSGGQSPGAELAAVSWLDGTDPYRMLADRLPPGVWALDEHLPFGHAHRISDAGEPAGVVLAGNLLAGLRMRKTPDEVLELASIGAAIDRVHRDMGRWLRAGRTEHEVAADIAAAMLADGHTRADFVIVGSGPNGASPHHEASHRVIEPGDVVVVDIGGPNEAGYFSDCTRTYRVAGADPDRDAARVHHLVQAAQQAAVDAVTPGVSAESIDAAARAVIVDAGYGEYFITRTGHGIGLEVHEEPYVVGGNTQTLEPGMAFSVEPGIYLPGRFGVRIEDIVVVGEERALPMNDAPRGLQEVGLAQVGGAGA